MLREEGKVDLVGWLAVRGVVRRGSGRIPRKKGTSGDGTSSRGIRECGWRRLRDVMDGWDSLGLGLGCLNS